jgi:hypothetical protein
MGEILQKVCFFLFLACMAFLPISGFAQNGSNTGDDPALNPKSLNLRQTAADYSAASLYGYDQKQALEDDLTFLIYDYKKALPDGKIKLRQQITEVLYLLFDIQIQRQEEEVRRLEAELQEVKESLDFRKKNRDEIVKKRLKDVTTD